MNWTIIGDSICSLINDAAKVTSDTDESGSPYTSAQLDEFESLAAIDCIPTHHGYRYNARSWSKGKVFIVASVDIPAGSEIFYPYGK
jgi:hypothetical protein